ncbi:SPOR domain-containing protein [Inhella proteolytica]|uniref:SPOR domain-containing protein n=1 Tax=Inhella proteolytica TaxID=2795029 RepID=A0A931NFU0_9BURK|nr:SPOR domain-containing protein [Inhella proteolytica]MBH9576451.1 SPOR domain-containing protein [Inhella proteolytica]
MDLLSLFRRSAAPAEAPRGKRSRSAAAHDQAVQQLRQRARHRLIGAAVLVGLGLLAFPLVFETQPRPVPMDLPIVIPAKETAPPLAPPPSVAAATLPEAAQRQPLPDPVPEAAAEPEPRPAPAPEAAAASKPEASKPVAPPAERKPPQTAQVAQAAQVASAPVAAGRFIVQVGAFAERAAAQEARAKLERKGLKTYTQVAKTKDGDRIRVRLGPFADRAEAERAASTAKGLGLAGQVLTL